MTEGSAWQRGGERALRLRRGDGGQNSPMVGRIHTFGIMPDVGKAPVLLAFSLL